MRHVRRKGTRVGSERLLSSFALALVLGFSAPLAGCSGPSHVNESGARVSLESPGTSKVSKGDWDDIWASVWAAALKDEMAVVDTVDDADGGKTFDLVGTDDQRTVVKAKADGTTIYLWAKVGRFGNPEREQGLLDLVDKRLRMLFGRDSILIPGYP